MFVKIDHFELKHLYKRNDYNTCLSFNCMFNYLWETDGIWYLEWWIIINFSFYKPDPLPHSLPSHGNNELSSITVEPVVEVGCVEDVVTMRKRVWICELIFKKGLCPAI